MNYEIRNIKTKELEETLNLVKSVFDEFEAPYYSEYGTENFYKFANHENLEKMLKENLRILVAKCDDKIIGMIAYRDYSHISMLFVDKKYHHNGIEKELTLKMISDCKQNNKELLNVTVNSSPYAVGFYEKLGFVKQDEEKEVDGIKFTPMKKIIYELIKYEDKDFDELHQIKKECFKWYVEKIYGWDDEIQIKYSKEFIEKYRQYINVIKYGNKKIGIFTNYIDENNESVISLFFIDKEYQNLGIGGSILKDQLNIDIKNNRNTILQVFKENRARFLYNKMGFKVYEETEHHYKMRRKIV